MKKGATSEFERHWSEFKCYSSEFRPNPSELIQPSPKHRKRPKDKWKPFACANGDKRRRANTSCK
ncbi:hypothetical protein EEX84_15445 [Planococcus salinus]|uniref:Uncharacterized protein n=1 Tax=Planococcus salinus TaxID=1848460 RepID=A0A3M8P4W5_9BACL|nr:hypothetical protein EEX84_15445 [Planococcus salinus]